MTTEISDGDGAGIEQAGEFETVSSGRRTILIAITAVAIVLVAGAVFAFQRFTDADLSALTAVPDDVDIVFTLDLLQLADSDRLNALFSTFAEPMADAGYIDRADIDIAETISQSLEEELDIDLGEDVLSWIGRSMAVGVWLPSDFSSPEDPGIVLSMSIRDKSAADDFLRKVGDVVDVTPLKDGDRYAIAASEGGVVWLGDELLLFASSDDILIQALAAREGGSLLEDGVFTQVMKQIPSERLFVAYISSSFFESIAEAAESLTETSSAGFTDLGGVQGVAFSVSLPDAGIRVDAVQLLEDGSALLSSAPGDLGVVDALPADTIGFLSFVIPEGSVGSGVSELGDIDPVAYDEVIGQMSADLGVDIEGEVLPAIGGENVLAVVPDQQGALARQAEVPISLLFSLGLLDPEPIENLLSSLETVMREMGLFVVGAKPASVFAEQDEVAAYEVTDDALVIGSSAAVVDDFLHGTGGLPESDLYRELDGELPGSGLAFFVDMAKVFDLIDMSPEDRAIADPVRGMGAVYSQSGNLYSGSFIILIDYLP